MATAPKTWYSASESEVAARMVDSDLDQRGEDRRRPSANPIGERSPEVGEDGLQQEEHQGVADRLDRRGVEPLHDVGRQKQRHTPVADRVGGVDQPAGDQASPDAGQVPKPRLGSPARPGPRRSDATR